MSGAETRSYRSVQQSGGTQFERWSGPVAGPGNRDFSVSAGYRRCFDFDTNNDPGQDFCAFATDGQFVVAVVADGVSQSFMGHLAAESVGRALLESIWAQRDRPITSSLVKGALEQMRGPLHQRVQQYQLGPEVAAMVRGALEETRASAGSQTVFGALRLDLHRMSGEVVLLGDILVLVHPQNAAIFPIRVEPRGRFSDIDGLRGQPEIRPIENVGAVVLKSDGLADAWGADLGAVTEPEIFRNIAAHAAAGDDLSYIAVILHPSGKAPSRIADNTAQVAEITDAAIPSSSLLQTRPSFGHAQPMELGNAVQLHASPQKPQTTGVWPQPQSVPPIVPLVPSQKPNDQSSDSIGRSFKSRIPKAGMIGFIAGFVLGLSVTAVAALAIHLSDGQSGSKTDPTSVCHSQPSTESGSVTPAAPAVPAPPACATVQPIYSNPAYFQPLSVRQVAQSTTDSQPRLHPPSRAGRRRDASVPPGQIETIADIVGNHPVADHRGDK